MRNERLVHHFFQRAFFSIRILLCYVRFLNWIIPLDLIFRDFILNKWRVGIVFKRRISFVSFLRSVNVGMKVIGFLLFHAGCNLTYNFLVVIDFCQLSFCIFLICITK